MRISHGAPHQLRTGGGAANPQEEELTQKSGQDAITALEEDQVPTVFRPATLGKRS